MPIIHQLDPALVNKIAAGEVIERPASVVKELVENAIDAGATRVEIELEQGGATLIRVADDGAGMSREDLPLAVASHATSKITTSDDLFNIGTLGFRGEALASIASVAHVRIVSRPHSQTEGYELLANDGQIEGPRACAAPPGTSIEVRHLFHNVPARRKFLRQPATEFANATEQIARLALGNPKVAFSQTHNGRSVRALPTASDRRERIADFYGPELAGALLPVNRLEHDVGIEALIAPPAQSRASTKWQYLFLNGRFITDRRIAFAVREAFRGLVEHDRYPVTFIFLTVDPKEFDVNVHPTKIEVRWRDSGLIQSMVLAALRETLLGTNLTPRLFTPASQSPEPATSDHQLRARQALADYLKSIDPTQARIEFTPPRFSTEQVRPSISVSYKPEHSVSLPGTAPAQSTPTPPAVDTPRSDDVAGAIHPASLPASGVLQVHNTYIVAQTSEGIIIVDQHALHERILYEKFRERFLAGPLESQGLLIPVTFEASASQVAVANDRHDLLARLGIEVSNFGPRTLAVNSFPTLLQNLDIAAFMTDLLDGISETSVDSEETLVHKALDMMACKAAVKAGDVLTTEEMQTLLMQRVDTQRSSNCPHGRPTTLELTTRDLEKQFKRI
jgi:DNA mismatch repair protein MutL